MIYQGLRPKYVDSKLDKLGCTRKTYAAVAGFSDAMLSLFLSGERALSYAAQERGFRALKFLEELAEDSRAPVDFRQTDAIVNLWRAWEAKCQESKVLRLGQELMNSTEGAEATTPDSLK